MANGLKVIVPVSEGVPQFPPVVVTVYVKGVAAETEGEPLMVTVVPATVAVTPAGNPVTVAPVAVPPKVYVIGVIAELIQTVCVVVAVAEANVSVANGFTVIVPVSEGVPQEPPVVVTV